ncbi:MAG: hypothetical protein J6B10_09060 [Lachnospiraceae bacterium]|nr:hypothetical protein [Lachnospiraceae bacterium]
MKTKQVPPIVMLLAGAVAVIAMYVRHYELRTLLSVLLGVLIVSYIAGWVIKAVLDKYVTAPEPEESPEGDVIAKESDRDETEGGGETKQTADSREAERPKG